MGKQINVSRNALLKEDFINKKFGMLTIIDFYHKKSDRQNYARCLCKCDCGNIKEVRYNDLKRAKFPSCGCNTSKLASKRMSTHLKSNDIIYRTWTNMKCRCFNVNDIGYKNYGGRGITICDDWMKFENFYKDMGDPEPGYTLDRIDNNKNYCKENCKWSNKTEQANNRSSNRIIKYKGFEKTLSEWCRELGLNNAATKYRLDRSNWTIEEAFELPKYCKEKYGRWKN